MLQKLSRYQGCLLGLAVGDAMGSPIDKKSWEEICQDYGPNGLMGYDLVNGYAEITSYTQLAAYASNGLLLGMSRYQPESYGKFIYAALKEWAKCQENRTPPDRCLCWVSRIPAMRRRLCMDTRMLDTLARETAGTLENSINSSSYPSALTCSVVVGLFFDAGRMEPRQIGTLSAETMALTSGDPETILASAVLAYSIAGIVQDGELPLQTHFTNAVAAVRVQFGNRYPQAEKVAALVEKAITLANDPELTPLVAMTILNCTTASECLAGAIYTALVHPENFDEGMISAVNHSGRSGAVGAVTGAILGAKLGVEALPDFYLESLDALEVLKELATDMTQGKQITKIFDDSWDQKYVQGRPVR